MGGRITAQATVAHRWADPEFAKLLTQAHTEIQNVLLAQCQKEGYGDTLTACAGDPYAGLSTAQQVDRYTQRLTYGFTRTGKAGQALDTPADAAALLVTAFPELTAEQRTQVLERTATDSGYPLDPTGTGTPSRQRIDLAAAMAAHVVVGADGSVTVTDSPDATRASVADASRAHRRGRRTRRVRPGRVHVRRGLAEEHAHPGRRCGDRRVGRAGEGDRRQLHGVVVQRGFTTRTVTVTSANGAFTRTYTVGFQPVEQRPPHWPGAAPGAADTPAGPGGTGGGGLWSPVREWERSMA